jgi:hypothetical protein
MANSICLVWKLKGISAPLFSFNEPKNLQTRKTYSLLMPSWRPYCALTGEPHGDAWACGSCLAQDHTLLITLYLVQEREMLLISLVHPLLILLLLSWVLPVYLDAHVYKKS